MDGKLKKTLELMRERLLDLTGRNPLLNTKFSDRSHSHIRVVDEVPKVLFNKLKNGYMVLKALPPIDQQLPDESTEIFKDTLLNFKTTDEDYLSALASVDYLDEKSEEQVLKIERGLIDKVRKHLKLPERVWCDKSLLDHAKQHNINPSYELPNTNEIHEDGRHDDNYVQTLLLPDLLERKLEKIISKSNLWEDELGVQVLFIAYGFLEWKESQNDKVRISPLLLQSCKLERVKHGYGFEYRVSTDDSSIDLNLSLKIKLENDFGLTLPDFICNESDDNVEQYFDEILNIKNDRIPHLRFSRQIAIGIFPSSKQVMYDDLKADDWLSNTHSLVDKFFSLNQITQNESLPNEPEVESDPFMENSPWVVSEADSSQYAVITRLMNGENLAVEGPPGTGKSQTIVNSIAAALADGKSVLFVAEKKAALEVVKNRLDTNGLGNFCLPILSGDSKSAFYEKIKKRIEMEAPPQPRRFDSDFSQLIELKEKFNNYIELLNLNINFGGMTLRDLMGKVIFNNEFYNNLPPQVRELKSNIPLNIEYSALENVKTLLVEYERLNNLLKPQDTIWKKINSGNINNFDIDDINSYLHNGLEISKKLLNNIKSASLINELSDIKKNDILKLLELAKIFNENYKEILVDLVEIKFEFIGKKFMPCPIDCISGGSCGAGWL